MELGRSGEDAVFDLECHRLAQINTSLASLVLPFYKLRHRPGYDILSFDASGVPVFIEVNPDVPQSSVQRDEPMKVCEIRVRFNNGLVMSCKGGDVEEVISAIRKILN